MSPAGELTENLIKAVDHLFSDEEIHPILGRRWGGPDNLQGKYIVVDEMHKCERCIHALVAVRDAYCALKRADQIEADGT